MPSESGQGSGQGSRRASDAPDVVETGRYSEQGAGPEDDTTVYAADVVQGRGSPGPNDRRVGRAARRLSRDRLARRDPVPVAAPEPPRRLPTMGLLVTVFVGLCAAGVALAISLARPAPPPPPPEEPKAELPAEIDGVPVRRGLRRRPDAAGTP